jgi:catechol 2,3-dioxygenase-like lactoylglutathione lyase family enzyme|tara:strand:+ start:1853 stop:2248 length:396 start_codon:yes stop_codon:yes gene_type:complete
MANEVSLDSFDHVGMVVKNAQATAESWTKLMGVGPWRFSPGGAALKLAHGKLGDVMFELLEPQEGQPSLWADFLQEHGEGLHHVCTKVADVEAAATKLEADGGTIMIKMFPHMAYVNIGGPGSVIMELLKT